MHVSVIDLRIVLWELVVLNFDKVDFVLRGCVLFFFLLYLLPVCENCYVAASGMG